MDKSTQIVSVFGVSLPAFQDCQRCGTELACRFIDKLGYVQPCNTCQGSEEYQKEMQQKEKEKEKLNHIRDSVKGQVPVAVHEYKGQYLYTNHKGDIIKEEKARPTKEGEKWKK